MVGAITRSRGLTIAHPRRCCFLAASFCCFSARPTPARPRPRRAISTSGWAVAGSTCHGRSEATGKIVRQDELMIWQDPSSLAGSHSRAWRVLTEPRARAIAARLGIGDPAAAPMCLGCHVRPPAAARGPALPHLGRRRLRGLPRRRFGLARQPLCGRQAPTPPTSSRGMVPLENPRARAASLPRLPFRQQRARPVRRSPHHGRRPSADQLRARPVLHPAAASQ